jgi:photosynthetic reaction center H subunit
MQTGAITGYIDVAQLTLYAFWIFFAGLIYYLRQEDKREGYPLVSDRSGHVMVQGFPPIPAAKTFLLRDGGTYLAPPGNLDTRPIPGTPMEPWLGAPLQPTGNPMVEGIGPASFVTRSDHPDLTAEGDALLVPMRVAPEFFVEPNDPDPRGMTVIGADRRPAGTIVDLWIDRSEPQIRYLEMETSGANGPRRVLVPMNFALIDAKAGIVRVRSILSTQFAEAPTLADPDRITLREEDRVVAYFGGGTLYATPERAEPLV